MSARALIFYLNIPCDNIFLLVLCLLTLTWPKLKKDTRASILHMLISCDKIFLLVSKYLSLLSWPSLELVIKLGVVFHKHILNLVNDFLLFHNSLASEKDRTLHFNKCGSPSTKDELCQVKLKLVQWFLIRRFLNFVNVILLFCNYLPLVKGWALHLNKLDSPSPNDALCWVWLKLVEKLLRRVLS